MKQLGQSEQEPSAWPRQQVWLRGWLRGLVLVITLLPLMVYASFLGRRPPRTPLETELFQGITYQRQVRDQPRPLMIHIVSVDLTAPGVEVVVSAGATPSLDPNERSAPKIVANETVANTTSGFLQAAQVKIATNGSFFYPFREKTPWDYAPRVGDRAKVLGQAIANGNIYAARREPWHPVCVLPAQKLVISPQMTCPVGTQFALSGGPLLLERGQPARRDPVSSEDKPYARLVVALDQSGTRLWLIAVDGKQPFYSEGMTLPEVTALAQDLGADTALNLDGGGSTTLVQAKDGQPQLLNSPVHAKIPMLERPVANHLGIRARRID
ncbi:MAG: phosphodiester glycosidase family protein [Cyanobacteria bacterium P01_G01_bin.54]